MPFTSPAQDQLDELNDQMELFAVWDSLLSWTQRLADVARTQRRICRQALRQLEQDIQFIVAGHQPRPAAT